MEPISATRIEAQVQVNAFIRSVYNWMAIGLGLTGFFAYYVSNDKALLNLIFGTPLFWVLIIGELALVFFLSARVQKIRASTATALFLFYAALNGVTLSVIFIIWTKPLRGSFN